MVKLDASLARYSREGASSSGVAFAEQDETDAAAAGPLIDPLGGVRAVPVAEALAARDIPFLAATAYHDLPEPVFAGVPVLTWSREGTGWPSSSSTSG